ncbi:NDP-sugar synthase [Methanonatronarchaeum sp. AMET-Sl]|uniref:NDP-sugar synthase n=1 Tax=Methanonatronarchaeum sp. AMET-Sl TaxID=3037654 RepID=UPI00244E3A23|nr:NDP-sugar synthase [Methanonatronarchaeum sp. AMET-Sl]WGI17587.1 NDP-sugar synthase [Methanonatronarchaeum sp. AMET-Sl]
MKAVVLAGGKGTRLRPLSLERPKPLLPVGGKPILDWIIDSLPSYFDEVLLACNYMEQEIKDYYERRDVGVGVRIVDEPKPLGTGGAIKNMEEYIEQDFVVFNGDILSSIDVDSLIKFHRSRGGVGTLSLWGVDDPTRYGIVGLNQNDKITRFMEKPSPNEVFSNQINAGIYVFKPQIFNHIEPDKKISIEKEVFPKLTEHGLYGYKFDGYWIDIGTPTSYIDAHKLLKKQTKRDCLIYPDVVIEDNAVIKNSVLLSGARIKSDSQVVNSVIGSNTKIKDSVVRDSVVGDGCKLNNVEICDRVRVWNNIMLNKDVLEVF